MSQFETRLHYLMFGPYPVMGKLYFNRATWQWFDCSAINWERIVWNRWNLPNFEGVIWRPRKTVKHMGTHPIPTEHNCWPVLIDDNLPYMLVRLENWHNNQGMVIQL